MTDKKTGECEYCGRALSVKRILTVGGVPIKTLYTPCCCKESLKAAEEEEQKEIEAQRRRREREILSEVRRKFTEAGLPSNAFERKLTDLKQDAHNSDAIRKATLLCGGGLAYGQRGLWLQGSVGVGKTTVLLAIGREMASRGRQIGYCYAGQIQRAFVASMATDKEIRASVDRRYNYFMHSDVYLLDDLGVEARNPSTDLVLLDMVNTAYQDRKFLVITSNLTPEEYCSKLDGLNSQRIGRRIADMCAVETLGGTMWTKEGVRL